MSDLRSSIPTFGLDDTRFGQTALDKIAGGETCMDDHVPPESNYTIFEGAAEIQRLIIARAISGVHIQ
jgi:hypothetical protein